MYSNKTDLQEVMLHMKIVSVDIFLLDGGSPGWRPIVCRVNTDEGVSGYGEASVGFDTGASASYSMIKEVAPFVICLLYTSRCV